VPGVFKSHRNKRPQSFNDPVRRSVGVGFVKHTPIGCVFFDKPARQFVRGWFVTDKPNKIKHLWAHLQPVRQRVKKSGSLTGSLSRKPCRVCSLGDKKAKNYKAYEKRK
jgi:hypothetical protein